MEYLYSIGNSLEFLRQTIIDACKRLKRQQKIYIIMSILSSLIGTVIIIILISKFEIPDLGPGGNAFVALAGTFYAVITFQSISQSIQKGSLVKIGEDLLNIINKFGNMPEKIVDSFINFYSKLP